MSGIRTTLVALAAVTIWMLVKLPTGAFDPPPTRPAVPWNYLAGLAVVTPLAVLIASLATPRHPALEILRDL